MSAVLLREHTRPIAYVKAEVWMCASFAGLAIATALKDAQGLISPVVTPAALIPSIDPPSDQTAPPS